MINLKKCRLLISILVVTLFAGCKSTPVLNTNHDVQAAEGVDVYILPMDDFNYEFANRLADALAKDLKIKVRATLNLGSQGLALRPGTQQYSAESIFNSARRVVPNLTNKKIDTSYIVLTRRDINIPGGLRFVFSFHDKPARMAVVSGARLEYGLDLRKNGNDLLWSRLYKMTKRNIGDVYYGYTRSTNPMI